ncbi:MAG: TetR/AcrR family transcriptional regulator [Thermoleophilaceae bacterium]|nr:TetR/AcrR family transcriptional regulator [Thermoleophilaceae bacterium]
MITRRPAPTRERILDAAVDLFGRQGFRATSVGEIEAAAGLVPRRGALYKHFESKEALLEAAVERRGRAVDELEELLDTPLGDPRDEVRTLGRIAFREIGRDQAVLRIVMREGDNFPELRDRFHERIVRRGHEQAEARLRLLAERAGATEVDVRALAAILLASVINYRVLDTLFGRPPGDLAEDRYIEAWADSALRLLDTHGLLGEAATKEART